VEPLFTCFGYANLGLPLNPRNPFFYQTTPDPFGFTANPLGFGYRDLGIGTFLRSGFGSGPNPNADWLPLAPSVDGQMQVSTARNVAMTPPQCPTTEAGQTDKNGKPIPYFQKAFFHNDYAKSLKQVVHFYNTRDVFAENVTSGHCPEGTTEKVDCIRWTTNNPGGTEVHFGVVHYGTDPTDLRQMAKSPIQLNRGHPETTFRVRMPGLKPQTTYYYTVTSTESNGQSDGVESPVHQFTTPSPGERIVAYPPQPTRPK
jgi:Purple acid Phosphatase, N-terminal domain